MPVGVYPVPPDRPMPATIGDSLARRLEHVAAPAGFEDVRPSGRVILLFWIVSAPSSDRYLDEERVRHEPENTLQGMSSGALVRHGSIGRDVFARVIARLARDPDRRAACHASRLRCGR